jgi:hypothetical protein
MPSSLGAHDPRVKEPPLIHPVVFDQAFKKPDRVLAMLRRNGPYRWIGRDYISVYEGPQQQWFRETWMYDDRHEDPERRLILDNPLFIEGSRAAFPGFEIVRPESARINLMTPMPAQPMHVDLPYFRGMDHNSIPMHLLVAMGRSGLFERWMINISSGLCWLYAGKDGGLSFWPDGPGKPGSRIAPPLHNRAFVSDNQRMYHRVEEFGTGCFAEPLHFDKDAQIAAEAEGWMVSSGDRAVRSYRSDEVRISLLWKAVMFEDAEAARIHDEHLDDLDLNQVVDILCEGAAARGFDLARPADRLNDAAFIHGLNCAFPEITDFAPVVREL